MKKKPFSMKFDPTLIERIDVRAKERGIDRTAFFTEAVEKALIKHPVRLPKPREESRSIKASHDRFQARYPKIIAKLTENDGPLRAIDAPIAGWKENRPAPGSLLKQPKKAK